MPELPEVETVRIGIENRVGSRRIVGVNVLRYDLRLPIPRNLSNIILDCKITSFSRRGKYLLLYLDSDYVLLFHLGMSGRITVKTGAPIALYKHDHLVVNFEDNVTLVYNDARRFGLIDVFPRKSLDSHRLLRFMGPEPLSKAFDSSLLASRLNNRKTNIKSALMDQKIVAGIGNIYACEALFHARISPKRRAENVQGERAKRLTIALKLVFEKAIESGGSSLRDYVNPSGQLGYFQHNFSVYGREGYECFECGKIIKKIIQSGRSTFYCPFQQR